ncbi:GAF domain-containing protein [Ekhidna sp.]|uniref:GAF domain-containing protein n=1 Tax=Ekhidna sp. TaxID=2608089 RepID=UPI00329804C5
MSEQGRLKELLSYQILDTSPEKQLDEIAEIASIAFDVPMVLISFLDDSRQWFKAKVGVVSDSFPTEASLCKLTIQKPDNVFIIEDATKDERTRNHFLVVEGPKLRFYAGIPLITPRGHAIGTLCLMDVKARKFTDKQIRLLHILAEGIMSYLNGRKTILKQKRNIELNAEKLKQLTDQAPGIIFQLEVSPKGKVSFPFLSKGVHTIDPGMNVRILKKDIGGLKKLIYKKDFPLLVNSLKESAENMQDLNIEFRINVKGKITWHLCMAKPEKKEDGTITWFGTFQDITSRVEYENTIEQISFDISHMLRRPVTTLLGLSSIIENDENLDAKKLKEYSGYIHSVSDELDKFTRKLNETYIKKSEMIKKIKG